MAERVENWRLILEAARSLTDSGQAPFTRISVYEWIWRRYPQSSHDRPSLDPAFQGMVKGATGGPRSLAGTPLLKVERGRYILAPASAEGQEDANVRLALPAARQPGGGLVEDEVKQGAKEYLEASGFSVTVAWGHQRGIDISAVSENETLFLEAKGSAVNPPQQVNYFVGALGELLQRMSDPAASYGLALPDNSQYRGLISRLPALTWERLRFTVLFITAAPSGGYTVQRISAQHFRFPGQSRHGVSDTRCS